MKSSGLVVCLAVAGILIGGSFASAKAPTFDSSGNRVSPRSVTAGSMPVVEGYIVEPTTTHTLATTAINPTTQQVTIGGASDSNKLKSPGRDSRARNLISEFDR